jgi:hypothetical protein
MDLQFLNQIYSTFGSGVQTRASTAKEKAQKID